MKTILTTCLAYILAIFLLKIALASGSDIPLQPYKSALYPGFDPIISELARCESRFNPQAIHYKDGDGTDSVGILQFKRKTFSLYWKKLINKDVEEVDIDNLWPDPQNQLELANQMILSDPRAVLNWRNCWKGYLAARSADTRQKSTD